MSEGATRDRVAICLFCNFWPVLLLKAARVEQSLTVQVCVMAVAVPPAALDQTVIYCTIIASSLELGE